MNGGTIAGGHVSGLGRGRVGSAAHARAGLYVAPLAMNAQAIREPSVLRIDLHELPAECSLCVRGEIRCLAEDERPTCR